MDKLPSAEGQPAAPLSHKYTRINSWLVRTRSKTRRGAVRFLQLLLEWPKLSLAVFVVLFLSVLISRDLLSDEIVLEPIEVDSSLKPLSSSGVTRQLVSEMVYLKREANTSFKQYGNVVDAPLLVPINIKTGLFEISTAALADLVRGLLGHPRLRITGIVLPESKDKTSVHIILYTPNQDEVSCNAKADMSDGLLGCAEKLSSVIAPYPMAAYFFQRRRWDEAREQTLKVMRDPQAKNRKWGYNLYGQLCVRELDFTAARKNYDEATKLDNNFSVALINLGNLEQLSSNDSKKAEDYYRRALQSKNSIAASDIGDLMLQRGNTAEADKFYRLAISLDPSLAPPYSGLGELAAKNNDLGSAKIWFGHALQLSVDKADPYIRWGRVYLSMGSYPAAELRFRWATSINGSNKLGWALLGSTLAIENNYSEARQAILKALPDWYQSKAATAAPSELNSNSLSTTALLDGILHPYDALDVKQIFQIIALTTDVITKCGNGWERDPQKCQSMPAPSATAH